MRLDGRRGDFIAYTAPDGRDAGHISPLGPSADALRDAAGASNLFGGADIPAAQIEQKFPLPKPIEQLPKPPETGEGDPYATYEAGVRALAGMYPGVDMGRVREEIGQEAFTAAVEDVVNKTHIVESAGPGGLFSRYVQRVTYSPAFKRVDEAAGRIRQAQRTAQADEMQREAEAAAVRGGEAYMQQSDPDGLREIQRVFNDPATRAEQYERTGMTGEEIYAAYMRYIAGSKRLGGYRGPATKAEYDAENRTNDVVSGVLERYRKELKKAGVLHDAATSFNEVEYADVQERAKALLGLNRYMDLINAPIDAFTQEDLDEYLRIVAVYRLGEHGVGPDTLTPEESAVFDRVHNWK